MGNGMFSTDCNFIQIIIKDVGQIVHLCEIVCKLNDSQRNNYVDLVMEFRYHLILIIFVLWSMLKICFILHSKYIIFYGFYLVYEATPQARHNRSQSLIHREFPFSQHCLQVSFTFIMSSLVCSRSLDVLLYYYY